MSQKKSQGRPRCKSGYWAAQATAKIVMIEKMVHVIYISVMHSNRR